MWRYLFLVPVYILSASIPLALKTGTNLEYEYALLASYLALVLIPAAAVFLPARYLPVINGQYTPPIAFEIFWIFLISPLFGLAGGAYLYWSGYCQCSEPDFGFWMLILWYPAWILAHAVYHAVLRGRTRGIAHAKLVGVYLLILFAMLVYCSLDLWFHPQKRLVNLVAGFLHGPIYDEWIAFDGGIMLARSAHLLLAMALLFLVWLQGQTAIICTVVALFCGWAVTGTLATRYPSTVNGKGYLDALMPASIEGDGFTMHYRTAPRLANATAKSDGAQATSDRVNAGIPIAIRRLQRDASFHISELKRILGERHLPHVEIYVYPSNDQKKLWFGGGSTDVTDVHTPSIHITASGWPHPTLRHELVHALSSDIGYHGLGFHPNMAFTEGLAVALAPETRTLSLHEGAAALINSGKLPPLAKLFSPAFWEEAGGRAYTVAGSLIQFLIEKHGIGGVKELYAGKSWEDAFHESQAETLKAWRTFVLSQYDKDKLGLYAEALYRDPGVLNDLCPHSKADLARNRDESVFTRLRQPVSWDPHADYLPWLLKLDPQDQEARLRLWRQEIQRVATDRFPAPGRIATWREALSKARHTPPQSLEEVEMGILESDLARLAGDTAASLKILSDLQEYGKHKFYGHSLNRDLEARLKLEQSLPPDSALEWRKSLAGWRRSLPEATANPPWIVSYLLLRNSKPQTFAKHELEAMLSWAPDPTLSNSFAIEWYRMLALRLMQNESYPAAELAYGKAAATAPAAERDLLQENIRRAAYYSSLGPLAANKHPAHH